MKKPKEEKPVSDELIDQWLKQGRKPEDVNGLLKQITKAVVERAMQGEMTSTWATPSTIRPGTTAATAGTESTRKTLKGDFGEVELETPRDRNGEFEPQIVKKNQTRWTGFDDKILSMYSRGMTTRDIQGHLEEMYQVEVSPSLISDVTDGVMEQARAWQNRPLEPFYGVVFLDALYVKMRHEGRVENRAVYVAMGINLEGRKGCSGAVDLGYRRRQVLAERADRAAQSRGAGYLSGVRGRAERVSAGDRIDLPESAGAALHRAHDPEPA